MRRFAWLAVVGVALLETACGGRAVNAAMLIADDGVHAAGGLARVEAASSAVRLTMEAARAQVSAALPQPESDAFRSAVFLAAVRDGDLGTAALVTHFWRPSIEDADVYDIWLRTLPEIGRRAQAESIAWEAAQTDPDERDRWMRAWYAAMSADPSRFPPAMGELVRGVNVDELNPFDGSSSIILRFIVDDETIGVFKPHQNVRHQSYRGEVAAYRLCELIRCTFDVPLSEEAFVEESEFRRLVGVDRRDPLHLRTERRTPTWFRDGDDRRVVYGVFKTWVPEFCRFPIEYVDVWASLVSTGVTRAELEETSIRRALGEFAGRERGFFWRIVELADDMTASDLARQLGELHVFDFLINNFDRYQPDWYGMNAHWQRGGFVSIDNGASFFLPEEFSDRATRRRLERVEVFPRSMIDAIRWMDADAAFEILFPPNPHFGDDRERFEAFLDRRARLLEYVDGLVDDHGEDAVYLWE